MHKNHQLINVYFGTKEYHYMFILDHEVKNSLLWALYLMQRMAFVGIFSTFYSPAASVALLSDGKQLCC